MSRGFIQHGVGYTKISSELCGIHPYGRSGTAPLAIIHIFAVFFEVEPGGHRADTRGAIGPNAITKVGFVWAAPSSKKRDH